LLPGAVMRMPHMLRNDHKLMIEQGTVYAVIRLKDKTEVSGRTAAGTWTKTASDTSDDKEVTFTSSADEYLRWNWDRKAPGVLLIGVESDQSKSSHKTGDGKWLQVLISVSGVSRDAAGKFAVAGEKAEGKGKLTYQNRLFKAGDIGWTIVRYER
jgi:hypothetical protein